MLTSAEPTFMGNAGVWTAEALNTAFEYLADATTKEYHPVIGQAKDLAAGALLIIAIIAAIVGLLVFESYVLVLIHSHSS